MKFRLPTFRFFIRNFLQQNPQNGLGKKSISNFQKLSRPKMNHIAFFVCVHEARNLIADQLSMIRPSR